MAGTITPLDQLKSFLNEIFQFETQDLDFGIYKIMHYKRKEIRNFIDKLLVEKVTEQLKTISDDETKSIGLQLKELEKDDVIKGWMAATDSDKATLEKLYPDKFRLYHDLTVKAKDVKVSEETQNLIYNHLTQFFSRYYDKGDFISKRRFGKNEKYVVPYNGEETHFYWANHDQYYIKSSETFQHYAFRVSTHTGTLTVHFKLHNAQIEQGNVKADEPNFFMLAEKSPEIKENDEELNFILANKQPEIGDHEVTFYFDYRPLDDSEKNKIKVNNKQDALDEIAYEFLKKEFSTNPLFANLWKEQDGKPLLLKKLRHYTRKNQYDFFVHKNLKAFLARELDFYIKTELVNVDDLYVTDTEEHLGRLKHNLRTIKVFKSIADIIIDFVHQIEDFQKKLWEKKKFVISTDWVITIDRLVEYLNNEEILFLPILTEVIHNKEQLLEWKALFGEKIIPSGKLDANSLKHDLLSLKKLPIDTTNFDISFKNKLLNILSEKIDIDKKIDGWILQSDNYHGLKLTNETFRNIVQSIYIDPPYNTDASAILYKNGYKDSCFASLIDERVRLAADFLKQAGIICTAIDDEELFVVRNILKSTFIKQVGLATVRSNPAGRKTKGKFAPAHEYALFYAKGLNTTPAPLEISENRKLRFPKVDENGHFAWANFIRSGNNDRREDRPKLYYPIFISKDNQIRVPKMEWDDQAREYKLMEKPKEGEQIVFPIIKTDDGEIQKNWQRGHKRLMTELEEYRVRRSEDNQISIDFKTRMDESSLPITWWDKKEYASANYGAAEMKALFGDNPFDFPKALKLVEDCIRTSGSDENGSIVLDFFPGSGTTFHACQNLNLSTNSKRKTLLIEQGEYVYSIIIPRIKKIAYTFDWKDGKPKDGSMNGLGIFFKYQRLEQYEEALENIAFNAPEKAVQKALEFDQYIPKYFLEFETKGSNTLVNTEAMKDPWDYRLKVWDGFTYDTEMAVDMVETFNYLIGLHMQKCITKEINGRMYQFIYGNNNANKKILVIWRNVKGWTPDDYTADSLALKKELAYFKYDLLYINDQAHIDGYQPIEEVFKNKMLN